MSMIPTNPDTKVRVNKAFAQLNKDINRHDFGDVFVDYVNGYNNGTMTLQAFAGATRAIIDFVAAVESSSITVPNNIVYSLVGDIQVTYALSELLQVLETELRLSNELGAVNTMEYLSIHSIMSDKLNAVINLGSSAVPEDLAHAIYDSLDTATANRKLSFDAIETDVVNTVLANDISVSALAANIYDTLSSSYYNSVSILGSVYFNNKDSGSTARLVGSGLNEIYFLNDLNTILYDNRIGDFADLIEDNYVTIAYNIYSGLSGINSDSSSHDLTRSIIDPIGISDPQLREEMLEAIVENSIVTAAKIADSIGTYIGIILADYSPDGVAQAIDGILTAHTLSSTALSADISSSVVNNLMIAQRIIDNTNDHILASSYTGSNRDLGFAILTGISPISSTNSNDLISAIGSSAIINTLSVVATDLVEALATISSSSENVFLRDTIINSIGSSYFDPTVSDAILADINNAQLDSPTIANNISNNLASASSVEEIVDAIFKQGVVSVFNPNDPVLLFNDITNSLLSVAQIATNIQSSIEGEQTATGIANAIFGTGKLKNTYGVGFPINEGTLKDLLLNDVLDTVTIAGIIGEDNLYVSLDINGNILDNTLTAVSKATNQIAVTLQAQLGNVTELSNAIYLNIADNIYDAIGSTSTSIELATAIISKVGLESTSQAETIDLLKVTIDHSLSAYPIAQNIIASILAIENFAQQDSSSAIQSLSDAILVGMELNNALSNSSLLSDISSSVQSLADVTQRIIENLQGLNDFTPSSFADTIASSITIAGLLALENAQFDQETIIEDLGDNNSTIINAISSSIIFALNTLPANPSVYNIRDAIFSSTAVSSSHNGLDELKLIADLEAIITTAQDIGAYIVEGLGNIDYDSTTTDIANVLFGPKLNQITNFGEDNENFLTDINSTMQTIDIISSKMQSLVNGIILYHLEPLTPANLVSNAILSGATIGQFSSSDVTNLIEDITFAGTIAGIIGQTDISDIVDAEGNLSPNTITAKLKAIDGKVDNLDGEVGSNFASYKNSIIQANIKNALQSILDANNLYLVDSNAAAPINADFIAEAIVNSVGALNLGEVSPNLTVEALAADISSTSSTYSIGLSSLATNLKNSVLDLGFGAISANDLEGAIFAIVSSYTPNDSTSLLLDIQNVETISGDLASIDNGLGVPFTNGVLDAGFYACSTYGLVGVDNVATLIHTAVDTTNGWLDTMKACMKWTKSGFILDPNSYHANVEETLYGSYDNQVCYYVGVANAFAFCMGAYYSDVPFYIDSPTPAPSPSPTPPP